MKIESNNTLAIKFYLETHFQEFNAQMLFALKKWTFQSELLGQNPYLLRAKKLRSAADLIEYLLDGYLFTLEEELIQQLLEGLAVFVCASVYGGKKTKTVGIDLEFEKDATYYFVSIKSGPNWGNSDQMSRMRQNFLSAAQTHLALFPNQTVTCVNGCCYGRDNKPQKEGYLKLCGQRFWTFISGDAELYYDLVEPLGYKAREKNEAFMEAYNQAKNLFTLEFLQGYCIDGKVDWKKILALNSGIDSPAR